MKIRILAILMLLAVFSGYAQEKDSCCFGSLDSQEFYLMHQEKQVLIIDVRSAKEFKQERIQNAQLAENKNTLEKLLKNESRETTILVYCKEGHRSKKAAVLLCRDLNFSVVYNLKGGIIQWKKEGYAVINE